MAARRASPFDKKREEIAALEGAPEPAATAALRRLLGDKNAYLVGDAAAMAQKRDLRALIPDLVTAWERLLSEGKEADKGCLGKKRVLEALVTFEAGVPSVYLVALRTTQIEWTPRPVDTAAPLRGLAAHALVQIDHHALLLEIAPLLADPEAIVRAEAAHALGRSGVEAAAALLHLKALGDDPEPDVFEACYGGLLRLAPARYLPLVAAVLDGGDARAEAAALALGESRLRDALPPLRAALDRARDPRDQQRLAMALALLRLDEANAVLVGLVERGAEPQAEAAVYALAVHRHDASLCERVRGAVAARGSRRLSEALRERFG